MVSPAGFAANNSFQSGLEDAGRQYACPREVVSYTCTVVDPTGNPPIASSLWRGTAFNCPVSANEIYLRHSSFNTSGGVTDTCNSGAITAESVGVVDNCYTSRLMVNVSVGLNGTTVECTLSGVIVVGSRTILIAGTGKYTTAVSHPLEIPVHLDSVPITIKKYSICIVVARSDWIGVKSSIGQKSVNQQCLFISISTLSDVAGKSIVGSLPTYFGH